jgi:sugar phosphate isomerase/epimerase
LWETDILSEIASLLGQLGFQGINLGNAWALSADAILEALEGTGIVVSSLGGPGELQSSSGVTRARGIATMRKCLELAKALDCARIDDHYLPWSGPLQPDERLVIDSLKELAPDVIRTGVEIDLEPMFNSKSTGVIDLQTRTVSLLEAVGAPGFKAVTDFWHMQMQGNDIARSLSQYGKYTGVVHLSEGGDKKTEPGSAGFDYRPGFKALKKWGFSGWLVLECHPSDNDLEASWGRGLKYVQHEWNEA